MWSQEIENVLSSEKNFMGCFALDSLPSPVVSTTKTSLIVNTSYSHEKGDHWVALVMNQSHCFYFDSFGLPVLSSEIFDFLKPYHKVSYSDVCIQNTDSLSCGKFCIAFIKNVKNKVSYEHFLSIFDQVHLSKNDEIIDTIYQSIQQKSNLSRAPVSHGKMYKAPTSVFIPTTFGRKQIGSGVKRYKRKRKVEKSRKKKKTFKKKISKNKFKRRKKTKATKTSKVIKAAKKSTQPQFTRNF